MKLYFLLSLLFFSIGSYGQKVGIGTSNPDTSAQLDVTSTNKGFLPPRLTYAQRSSIPFPAAGLIIWCSDCDANGQLQVYNGNTWVSMCTCTALPENTPSLSFCEKTWMIKNLNVSTYRNGDPIPQVSDSAQWRNLTTGAWCWYNNDSALGAIYGKLYNWYAVNDPRGLAPQGWHVATSAEWDTLVACHGGPGVAGGPLKENGTEHWLSPNTGATNSSGFTALPGGLTAGKSQDIGRFGNWWVLYGGSNSGTYITKNILMDNNQTLVQGPVVGGGTAQKFVGRSVRCVKGELSAPAISTIIVSNLTATSASCGGTITDDGGTTIIVKGVVWSTAPNPTFSLSTKTIDGTGIGNFVSSITALNTNTTYYVRAYAKTDFTITYGNELSFTTENFNLGSGLIAYYPFTGNSIDSSGNGHNGVVNGATLTLDRFGNANKAYSFNGSSDYISVPNNPTLTASSYQLTITAWVKINQFTGSPNKAACLLEKANGSSGDWGINYQDFDANPVVEKLRFGGYVWYNSTIATAGYWTSTVPTLGQWYHIAYTIDGNSNSNFYINGVNESQVSGNFSLWPNTADLYFGRSGTATGTFSVAGSNYNYLNGSLDEIRIYNRVLNPSEIQFIATH